VRSNLAFQRPSRRKRLLRRHKTAPRNDRRIDFHHLRVEGPPGCVSILLAGCYTIAQGLGLWVGILRDRRCPCPCRSLNSIADARSRTPIRINSIRVHPRESAVTSFLNCSEFRVSDFEFPVAGFVSNFVLRVSNFPASGVVSDFVLQKEKKRYKAPKLVRLGAANQLTGPTKGRPSADFMTQSG